MEKALMFFDLETTGVDTSSARIVQFAGIKILPDGSQTEMNILINPGISIPADATAVHGITDDDVKAAPEFKETAYTINKFLSEPDDLVLAGFNICRYDVIVLLNEFFRNGNDIPKVLFSNNFLDIMSLYHHFNPRDLSSCYQQYCNAEFKDAHNALEDTKATIKIYKAMKIKHRLGSLEETVKIYADGNLEPEGKIKLNADNEPVLTFGKYKDQTLKSILMRDQRYLGWIIREKSMSLFVKNIIKKFMRGGDAT